MLTAITNTFYKPGVNQLIARLDDDKSMFSIAARDFVDNSGRTVMEWRRNPHGGRERLIEEFLTTLTWGFGIHFIKTRVYDPLARRFTAIKLPALDMSLVPGGKASPHQLDDALLARYAEKFPGVYDGLRQVLGNTGLRMKYHYSSIAKFSIATLVPALFIAFGIPTLNQALTRFLLDKEQRQALAARARDQVLRLPLQRKPALFEQFESSRHHVPGAFRFAGGTGFALAGATAAPGAPRFAGLPVAETMGLWTSNILQNEKVNTMLIDGIISGGRTYKTRNWMESLEVVFREGLIIFFLFFAQRPLQRWIGKAIDKLGGGTSALDFKVLRYLDERYGKAPQMFAPDLEGSVRHLFGGKAPALADIGQGPAWEALEKQLLERIHELMLNGQRGDLLVECAREAGWIALQQHNGQPVIDLTQKIKTDSIAALAANLEKSATAMAAQTPERLLRYFRKAAVGRFSAMMLANLVCAFFLSYAGPKIQHELTYRLTGRHQFPGIAPVAGGV